MYHVEYGAEVSETILDKKEDMYARYSRRICCPAHGEAFG